MKHPLIKNRRIIQAVVAVALYLGIAYFSIPLSWVVLFGGGLGFVFGKVFCRWMCPIGFMVELMMKLRGKGAEQMYMYHKLGCPIAWISGFLNRSSLLSIQRDPQTCTDCGICDKSCYISTYNPKYSHFKWGKKNPVEAYSCSRCLDCVAACPQDSLKFSPDL